VERWNAVRSRLPRPDPLLVDGLVAVVAAGLAVAQLQEHAELVVSDATVKSHVARLLAKLRLRDRVQAVVLAYESGLVRPGSK
jgi:ATP/maltotriose-dependent transcriptional regulator MalT